MGYHLPPASRATRKILCGGQNAGRCLYVPLRPLRFDGLWTLDLGLWTLEFGPRSEQPLQRRAGFGHLRQPGLGALEMRSEFLVLVHGLLALAGRLVELAEVEVAELGQQRRAGAHLVPVAQFPLAQ